ncbi:MAG: hypothetical protein ACYDA8_23895 [Deferrisomatales bacterium]
MSAGGPGAPVCPVPAGTDLTRAAAAIEAEAQAAVEEGRAQARRLADEARLGADALRARADQALEEGLAGLRAERELALAEARAQAAAAHRRALAEVGDVPEARIDAAVGRVLDALAGGRGR